MSHSDTPEIRVDASIVGYFTHASQKDPAYDPPHSSPCPVCGQTWTEDTVRTINVMPIEGDNARVASMFYRMHRTCNDALTDDQAMAYDQAAIAAGCAAARAAG